MSMQRFVLRIRDLAPDDALIHPQHINRRKNDTGRRNAAWAGLTPNVPSRIKKFADETIQARQDRSKTA